MTDPDPSRKMRGRPIISNRPESNFSPYELAAMRVLLWWLLSIACFLAFLTGRTVGGIVLGALDAAALIVLTMASGCPTCGKSPSTRDGLGRFVLYALTVTSRFWPERRCSRCGTALDVIPDDRR